MAPRLSCISLPSNTDRGQDQEKFKNKFFQPQNTDLIISSTLNSSEYSVSTSAWKFKIQNSYG